MFNLFNRYSIAQAADDYLAARRGLGWRTRDQYRRTLNLFAGLYPAWPPRVEDINNFIAWLYDEKNLADGGVWGHYRALHAWLGWLHRHGKLKRNPMSRIEPPPKNNLLPRAPQPEDVQTFFHAIATYPHRHDWLAIRDLAMFGLLLETGMRAGSELAALTMARFDLVHRTALLTDTKTRSDRMVVFNNNRLADWLAAWLAVRRQLKLPAGLDALFVVHHQQATWRAIDITGIRAARLKYCRRADIPLFRLHDLRHAYAIFALRGGLDLLDVQAQLGHKSLQTTMRYTVVADTGRGRRQGCHSPLDYALDDSAPPASLSPETEPGLYNELLEMRAELRAARAELDILRRTRLKEAGLTPAPVSAEVRQRAAGVLRNWLRTGRQINGSELGRELGKSTRAGRYLVRELLPQLRAEIDADSGSC